MATSNNSFMNIFILLCTITSMPYRVQSMYTTPVPRRLQAHNKKNENNDTNNVAIQVEHFEIIDTEKFIHDDLIKKYNDLQRMYTHYRSMKTNPSQDKQYEHKLLSKLELVEEACDIYIWTQSQQALNGKQISSIMLPNDIIEIKDQTTMLHYLSGHDSLQTIQLVLQNPSVDVNVRNNKNHMPIHYAISNQQILNIELLEHIAQKQLSNKNDTLVENRPTQIIQREAVLDNQSIGLKAATTTYCCCYNKKPLQTQTS